MASEKLNLEMASKWGKPSVFPYIRQSIDAKTLAIVFPGQVYPLEAPLMWYCSKVALESNFDVLGVEYGFQANRVPFKIGEIEAVATEVSEALRLFLRHNTYEQLVFIAKSLGTVIATQVIEALDLRRQNCFYLTPLPSTIPFLQKSDHVMVIVGDQDHLFGPSSIDQITNLPTLQLHVVPGADHALEISEDSVQSIQILQRVTGLFKTFCASLP